MIRDELLAMLVCPMGKEPLRLEGETLVCTRCGLRFAIEDDIPNMIVEEATMPDGCRSLEELACVRAGEAAVEPSA